jgi:hypothetical protein
MKTVETAKYINKQDEFRLQEATSDKKEKVKSKNFLVKMTEKKARKELLNTRNEIQDKFNKIFSLSSEELNYNAP